MSNTRMGKTVKFVCAGVSLAACLQMTATDVVVFSEQGDAVRFEVKDGVWMRQGAWIRSGGPGFQWF